MLRVVEGGAEAGEYLTAHPGIDHVHVTGSAATHDAGHNCIAAQVLVLSADWPQRAECFAGVLAVEEVPGVGLDFLSGAIAFANERLVGTLGASLLVDPATLRGIGAARFDEALVELCYGTIGVNVWTAFGVLDPTSPWGAFPGDDLTDVGSGVVHNALLLDEVERSVARGPFRPFPRSLAGEGSLFPKPPWFVTSRSAAVTVRRLAADAAKPGWLRMPPVFTSAFRA